MAVYVKVSPYTLTSFLVISGVDPKSPNTSFLMRAIQEVWRLNVSRFFKRHEQFFRPQTKFGLKPHKYDDIKTVFYCEVRGNSIVGVIDTSNAPYVHYLIHGVPPSSGAYIPALGARVKGGQYRGVSTVYWATWQSFFRREVYILINQHGFDTQRRRRRHRRIRPVDVAKVRAAMIMANRDEIKRMRGNYNGYI